MRAQRSTVWGRGLTPTTCWLALTPDTYTPLPWRPGVARFASDLFVDGEPHPYCPRQNLKRVLGELREEGYLFNVGIEPEHFLVTRQRRWHDQGP